MTTFDGCAPASESVSVAEEDSIFVWQLLSNGRGKPVTGSRGHGVSCFRRRQAFEKRIIEPDLDVQPQDTPTPLANPLRTQTLPDPSRSAITFNKSPDIPFDASLNPYRGCEHGCAYCYARPTHEYLGYSAGLDFETRILVKEKAPELLRKELLARGQLR